MSRSHSDGRCSCCGDNLRKGILAGEWKSCPECSGRKGYHVFRRYPEAFGTTDERASFTALEGPQSWCRSCRSRKRPQGEPVRRCDHPKLDAGRAAAQKRREHCEAVGAYTRRVISGDRPAEPVGTAEEQLVAARLHAVRDSEREALAALRPALREVLKGMRRGR